MKKLIFISMMIVLSACQKTDNAPNNANANHANEAVIAASSTHAGNAQIRQNFSQSCVHSALGNQAASNPAKQQFAEQVCDCVYEEGIQAYGGTEKWEAAIANFDKKQADSQLQKVSDDAIQVCLNKHLPQNKATASASAAQ